LFGLERTLQDRRSHSRLQGLSTQPRTVSRFPSHGPPRKRKRETLPLLQRRIGQRWEATRAPIWRLATSKVGRTPQKVRPLLFSNTLLEQAQSDKSNPPS